MSIVLLPGSSVLEGDNGDDDDDASDDAAVGPLAATGALPSVPSKRRATASAVLSPASRLSTGAAQGSLGTNTALSSGALVASSAAASSSSPSQPTKGSSNHVAAAETLQDQCAALRLQVRVSVCYLTRIFDFINTRCVNRATT